MIRQHRRGRVWEPIAEAGKPPSSSAGSRRPSYPAARDSRCVRLALGFGVLRPAREDR